MAGPGLPTSITANVTTGEVADTIKAYLILNEFDTTVTGATTGQVLRHNGTVFIHVNAVDALPANSVMMVHKSGGVWPARPTSRTDIKVIWTGADPSPSIVTPPSTGGMYSGVDERHVTP